MPTGWCFYCFSLSLSPYFVFLTSFLGCFLSFIVHIIKAERSAATYSQHCKQPQVSAFISIHCKERLLFIKDKGSIHIGLHTLCQFNYYDLWIPQIYVFDQVYIPQYLAWVPSYGNLKYSA